MGVFKITTDNDNTTTDSINSLETPVAAITEQNNTETNINPNMEKEIVIEGPLSSVYSNALNLAYAKESTFMTSNIAADLSEQEKSNGVFIYCCNGTELDNSTLIEASDTIQAAINNKRYKDVVLVMESNVNHPVSTKSNLLVNMYKNDKVRIYYSRKVALEQISCKINT